MNAQDLYKLGVDKYNSLLESMNDNKNAIKLDCTALEYVRTLEKMYAEEDGEYFECNGANIYNDRCNVSYFAVCMAVQSKKGKRLYKTMPGAFSKVESTEYTIIFSDKKANLLIGDKYTELKPITSSVKRVTGNVANRDYMKPIRHSKKNESLEEYVEHAKTADEAILADGLSDRGFNILLDKFIESLGNENKSFLGDVANAIMQIQRLEKHNYIYHDYTGNYKSKDIYSLDVMTAAPNILQEKHRLLIIGCSGDGKTQLAYLLAKKFTGVNIGEPVTTEPENYYRICVANAGDGFSLWEEDDTRSTIGKLRLFVEHMKKNNITEPCCFICNEIQASDLRYLISGSLFEDFNNSGISSLLPENLYLIFTACKDRDFGVDSQVLERIPSVELDYITESDSVVQDKLVKAFANKGAERVAKIAEFAGKINTAEGYQVVSMRNLIAIINGNKPNSEPVKAELSADGREAFEELQGYYGN